MTLREYLSANGISQSIFAQSVGLSQPQISRIINGTSNIPLDVLRRVHAATDGKVTPNDFIASDPTPSPTEAAA